MVTDFSRGKLGSSIYFIITWRKLGPFLTLCLVRGLGTMWPTRALGGLLTQILQDPRVGKIIKIHMWLFAHLVQSLTISSLYEWNSPQCLNKGGSSARCGMVDDRNYDFPASGVGTSLPNQVQGTYNEGSLIDFEVVVSAHHKGHFTYKVSSNPSLYY